MQLVVLFMSKFAIYEGDEDNQTHIVGHKYNIMANFDISTSKLGVIL